MRSINTEHREARTWSDWFALRMVYGLRWGMDFVTGYRHPPKGLDKNNKKAEKFKMTEREWLNRILFLESVAGVPGMVAGMLRHLRSLRTMRRDNGW
jgi:Alternative oxidase